MTRLTVLTCRAQKDINRAEPWDTWCVEAFGNVKKCHMPCEATEDIFLKNRVWVHLLAVYIIRLWVRLIARVPGVVGAVVHPWMRSCSLSLAILATNTFLLDPKIPACDSCASRDNYIVINSGAHNESFRTAQAGIDLNFTAANIVRTNHDRSGLLGLALTLYYETSTVGILDFREYHDYARAEVWMRVALRALQQRECDVVFSDRMWAVMSAPVARDLLMYTDIKYSKEHVVSVLMRWCSCGSKWRARVISPDTLRETAMPKTCERVPSAFQCERFDDGNQDFAVMVPAYKRNYMKQSIQALMMQSEKPKEIFILQNRMHVTFDFAALSAMSTVPIWHVWATNWNTFFFLTYVVMMFVEEKYSLKMDDDMFPGAKNSIEMFLWRARMRSNTILGVLGYTAPDTETFNCGINTTEFQTPQANDHVAWIVVMPAAAGKILHRFRAFTYLGGEDIAVSVTNNMECGTMSHSETMNFWNMHEDGNTSQTNDEVSRNVDKLNVGWILRPIYCHYIRAGYNPQTWKTFRRPALTDIRYPH